MQADEVQLVPMCEDEMKIEDRIVRPLQICGLAVEVTEQADHLSIISQPWVGHCDRLVKPSLLEHRSVDITFMFLEPPLFTEEDVAGLALEPSEEYLI